MNRFELKVNFNKKTKKNYKPTLSLCLGGCADKSCKMVPRVSPSPGVPWDHLV